LVCENVFGLLKLGNFDQEKKNEFKFRGQKANICFENFLLRENQGIKILINGV
jgi:hypothetical protein